MTTVSEVLTEMTTAGAVRRVLDYHRGSGPTPRATDFVRVVERADGRLCLRRVTNDGVCTVCHRDERWRCSEYERLLDRTNVGPVSRETVLDWLDGTRPTVVAYENVRESFRAGDERRTVSNGGDGRNGGDSGGGSDGRGGMNGGDSKGDRHFENGEDGGGRVAGERRDWRSRPGSTGGRPAETDDELARRADAVFDLETATDAMTAVDWSVVPDVSAQKAAAWTVSLAEARDALSAEVESYVPAWTVARANEEVGKA